MRVNDVLLALFVVLIWGSSFTVVKFGLAELPPFLFSALRFMVIAVAVFLIPAPRTVHWFHIVAIGFLLGVVKFGLLFIAMDTEVSAGSAALLLQMQVFFTLGSGVIMFQETISRQQSVGVGLALIGLVLFVTIRDGSASPFGIGLVLLAALTWTCVNVIMKHIAPGNLLQVMAWASLVPIIPLMLISNLVESGNSIALILSLSVKGWFSILYMGLLSTLTAYALWGRLLSKYTAINVAPFALLIPIIAISVSGVLLGERLAVQETIGMLMILIGLALCIIPHKLSSNVLCILHLKKKDTCL